MKLNEVKDSLSKIRRGTFARIHYVTELPLKAEFRNQGYKVLKESVMVTRFGIYYGNIKEVKERYMDTEPSFTRKNLHKDKVYWEDKKNRILYNSDKNIYYLYSFPTKKNRIENSTYIVEHNGKREITALEDCSYMVINSYWNKKLTNAIMHNIDNIISIGGNKFGI